MKTIAIANQKGGVGKTTLSSHLAWYIAEQNFRTLVIDLDSQGNLSSTLRANRSGVNATALFQQAPVAVEAAANLVLIEGGQALADINRAPMAVLQHFVDHIKALNDQFDVCIIDTAPAVGLLQIAALAAADFVVSPVELETYSIDGIRLMMQTIHGVQQKFNTGMRFLGMVPNRFNSHSPAQKEGLKALLKAHPSLVIPHPISLRTSIAEAAADRAPVWRSQKSSAREAGKEIKAAAAALVHAMGGLYEQ